MHKLCLVILLCASFFAQAGVMPEKSRIVFNEKNTVQSYMLSNTNKYPVVVQFWVDDGEFNSNPELTATPFVVTPVVLKMAPSKLSEIKVIHSKEDFNLPKDRESLYWLNMLEIPPVKGNNKEENEVVLSMLTQIKIIYRPESIEMDEFELIKTFDQLTFDLKKNSQGQWELWVNNPTAYVASLSGTKLLGMENNKKVILSPENIRNLTLLPKSKNHYPVNLDNISIQGIEYWLIDDHGKFYNKKNTVKINS